MGREVIHLRSADGRGPLFWAYEFGHDEAIKLLLELGVDGEMKDANGQKPSQMERVTPPQKKEDDDDDDYQDDDDYSEQAAANATNAATTEKAAATENVATSENTEQI